MPNNIHNLLKFTYHSDSGETIESIAQLLAGNNEVIDFSKIIPQPLQDIPEISNDWNIKNWGTKWNAYETNLETKTDWALVIRFQTAWDYPKPVLEAIMKKYSDLEIQIEFISACEGGQFAYHLGVNEGKRNECYWSSENDPGLKIRSAILAGIRIEY